MFSLLLIIAKGHVNWKSITQIMTHFHTIKFTTPLHLMLNLNQNCANHKILWIIESLEHLHVHVDMYMNLLLSTNALHQLILTHDLKAQTFCFWHKIKWVFSWLVFYLKIDSQVRYFKRKPEKSTTNMNKRAMGHITDLGKKTNRKQFLYQIYKNCGPFHKNSYEWFWS